MKYMLATPYVIPTHTFAPFLHSQIYPYGQPPKRLGGVSPKTPQATQAEVHFTEGYVLNCLCQTLWHSQLPPNCTFQYCRQSIAPQELLMDSGVILGSILHVLS